MGIEGNSKYKRCGCFYLVELGPHQVMFRFIPDCAQMWPIVVFRDSYTVVGIELAWLYIFFNSYNISPVPRKVFWGPFQQGQGLWWSVGASESVKRRRPELKLLQEDLPNRTKWSVSRQGSFRLKCLSLSQNVGGGNRNGESGFQVPACVTIGRQKSHIWLHSETFYYVMGPCMGTGIQHKQGQINDFTEFCPFFFLAVF